jgi:hypothetical protein
MKLDAAKLGVELSAIIFLIERSEYGVSGYVARSECGEE